MDDPGGEDDPGGASTDGRRRRLSEDQRRQQILAGCIRVLARDGYQQATLARVAREAGVSKGLVSHYFGDRDSLMDQTAIAIIDDLRTGVARRIDTSAAAPEVVRSAVREAAGLGRTSPDQLRAVDELVHNLRDADGRPRLDLTVYENTYRAQRQLFRRGQTEGTLRQFDTRAMAVVYQGAIDAMIGYLDAHPDVDREEFAATTAELLITAIRRPDGPEGRPA